MRWFLNGAIIVLTVLALVCLWLAKPTPGGVNTNVIMVVPAAFFGVLDLLFIILRIAE